MKFVADRESLTRALARVQGVVNRKATMPVLANALLEARPEGGLRVAATDLDITFDGRIDARVDAPGRITVDGRRLYEIVRNLPGVEVECTVDDDQRVILRCQNSEFVLHGLAADSYPALPSAEGIERIPLDGLAFRELLERTSFSVSSDESRPNLNGVYFHCIGDGRIRMVSTDGHRLSRGERDARRDADVPAHDGVIIPRKGIGELKRVLDEVGREVYFGFLENNLVLEGPDLHLFVRLIDAAFPDYTQVIPKATERHVALDRLSFLAALKRIAILASERTHGVRVEISTGRLTLVSDNPDLGKAREEIPLPEYEGADLTIAFNAKYVSEILGTLGAEKIEMGLNEALSPGLFREFESDDYLFVVMPMRL
jgi:DNA polymerase-3 subunit beta